MNKRRFKRGQQVIVKAPGTTDTSYTTPGEQRSRATVVVARSNQISMGGICVGVEFHSAFMGHDLEGGLKSGSDRGQWIPITRLHVAPDREQPGGSK